MNCANHPEVSAVAYCRTCGKAMCANCTHQVRGVVYCENCLAERLEGVLPPPSTLPPARPVRDPDNRLPSPGAAAALGFIPGVGAMYNGQFMKGVVHVLAFVCLIWMADHFGPIMVPIFFAYFFYLIFDAYKTAHAIEMGQPVPDPFGLERMFGAGINTTTARPLTPVPPTVGTATAASRDLSSNDECARSSRAPIGAFVLILLGVLFLLDNLGLFEFHWVHRLWPVILIVIGVWLFAKRWNRVGD